MRILFAAAVATMLAGCSVAHVVAMPVRVAGHVAKTGVSAVKTAASVVP